jgi:hypothetical protein
MHPEFPPFISRDRGCFPPPGAVVCSAFKHREFVWGQGAEAAVWSQEIVIIAPCCEGPARFSQADEHVLIEAFISQPAVE